MHQVVNVDHFLENLAFSTRQRSSEFNDEELGLSLSRRVTLISYVVVFIFILQKHQSYESDDLDESQLGDYCKHQSVER